MSINVARLTIFALLSSIEFDLRRIIRDVISPNQADEDTYSKEQMNQLVERQNKDRNSDIDNEVSYLSNYLDFADAYAVINRCIGAYDSELEKYFKQVTAQLEKLVTVRNRIAHSRPLNINDFPTTIDTCESLAKADCWIELKETLRKLKTDPSYVLTLDIQNISTPSSRIQNNLPTPDFDETGFLGRDTFVSKVVKQCKGPYPVITITGEGGIGKTAVALKVAYELLDDPTFEMDAIVWVTCKTTTLGATEIIRIRDAVETSAGLISEISRSIANQETDSSIESIIEYLRVFKILLILDNLETVLDDTVRDFVAQLPLGSKLLITSRIGLGAFEVPLSLSPMTTSECLRLIRILCEVRGLDSIKRLSDATLQKYIVKMSGNPGFIKWFITAIQMGTAPEHVLNHKDTFLEFCLTNVFNHLQVESKLLLEVFQIVPGKHDQSELAYLSEIDVGAMQQALRQLMLCNLVIMKSKSLNDYVQSFYDVTQLCREYMARHFKPHQENVKLISKRKSALVAISEKVNAELKINSYRLSAIMTRNSGDLVVAKYLLDAKRAFEAKDHNLCSKLIADAKKLSPGFFEIYRLEGYLQSKLGNYSIAQDAYVTAIELQPNSPQLRKWYGGFLLKFLNDPVEAEEQLKIAEQLDPDSFEVSYDLARAYLYQLKFDKALILIERLLDLRVLDVWNRRKLCKLLVSYYHRHAEYLIDRRDQSGAISEYSRLRNYLEEQFSGCIDDEVGRTLYNASPTLASLAKHCLDEDQLGVLQDLSRWVNGIYCKLSQNMKRRTGTVLKVTDSNSRYGYILDFDNSSIFFHINGFLHKVEHLSDLIGATVEYDIGTNSGGDCAVNILVVSNSSQP